MVLLEYYFEASEAFSDLNKAEYESFAVLAMSKGKTQATFLIPLIQALLYSSVSTICFVPFLVFNTAHFKFTL